MTELTRNEIMIDLEYDGEGWHGFYNPKNPDDEKLLRFTVYRIEDDDVIPIENASYCTKLPATITEDQKIKALEIIMDEIYEPAIEYKSIKRICEDLSWIMPESLDGKWEPS